LLWGLSAGYLSENFNGLNIIKYNVVNGQPLSVDDLVLLSDMELEKQIASVQAKDKTRTLHEFLMKGEVWEVE